MRPDPVMHTARPDLCRSKGIARPVQPIPNTGPQDYETLAAVFGDGTYTGGSPVSVSERSVAGLPALERGVEMVSNAVATMLVEAEILDDAGRPIPGQRPNVLARPSTLLGSFEFYAQAVATVMKRGNYIALLADHDQAGYAQQVVPIHPDMVQLDTQTVPGVPLYRIGTAVFSWHEVLHIRTDAPTGTMWGLGIIEKFRRHLTMQLAEAEFGLTSYSTGGVPSVVVQLDVQELTQKLVDDTKAGWMNVFGGGRREPAVVGRNFKDITPLSWSPHDVEFVNSAQLSVAQCAYMCGLRPDDLGASLGVGGGMTYGNRTDDALQRISDSYNGLLRLFEEAWSDLLPVGERVRGNVEALLRTSTKDRYELRQLAQAIGVETVAESRAEEHKPPLPALPAPTV